jgi:hypothetical protein
MPEPAPGLDLGSRFSAYNRAGAVNVLADVAG